MRRLLKCHRDQPIERFCGPLAADEQCGLVANKGKRMGAHITAQFSRRHITDIGVQFAQCVRHTSVGHFSGQYIALRGHSAEPNGKHDPIPQLA
jgi:hypothetical protein